MSALEAKLEETRRLLEEEREPKRPPAAAAADHARSEDSDEDDKVAAALARAARVVAAGGEGGVELAIERATEELQRRLRAKESELRIAERRVRALEATQRDLANELVAASRLVDEVGDPTQLAAELRELEERHGAALELMGETSEENEELRDRVDALKETVNALTQQLAANDAPGGA